MEGGFSMYHGYSSYASASTARACLNVCYEPITVLGKLRLSTILLNLGNIALLCGNLTHHHHLSIRRAAVVWKFL